MLKQETYEGFAEGFGSAIGVAQTIGFGEISDGGVQPTIYRKFTREMSSNRIISKAIEEGLYQKLQRNIYKISREDKRLKENTIIKRAWELTIETWQKKD